MNVARENITSGTWLASEEGQKALSIASKLEASDGVEIAYIAGIKEGIERLSAALDSVRAEEKAAS